MTVRRSWIVSLSAASLAAVVLAGCGQQTTSTPPAQKTPAPAADPAQPGPKVFRENWPDKVPTRGLAKGLTLPLETYMPSYADEISVQQARDTAEIACMRRYGFDNWRTEDLGTAPPLAANASNMLRRYGLTDLAEAKEYGYRPPNPGWESTPPPGLDAPDAVTVLQGRQGDGAVTSFKGKALPEGGCTGEVDRKVGTLDANLVERLSAESFERSQQTPAVKAAMSQWSQCMKDRGYQVNNVWDTDKLHSPAAGTASPEEIKLATADVECKTTTDLVKAWFGEETVIQKQLIKDSKSKLDESRSRKDSILSIASAINASSR
ncbi:hypothetical protein [Streptomyces filamentosus]|uniref:hypothetical protein n=1 Tax=Streptomyces filamentosus TaxID=67294 RepID=UPI00332ED3C8